MIREYFQKEASKIELGTHLGSLSDEDSRQYADATEFMIEEPGEAKWFFSIEKICHIREALSL